MAGRISIDNLSSSLKEKLVGESFNNYETISDANDVLNIKGIYRTDSNTQNLPHYVYTEDGKNLSAYGILITITRHKSTEGGMQIFYPIDGDYRSNMFDRVIWSYGDDDTLSTTDWCPMNAGRIVTNEGNSLQSVLENIYETDIKQSELITQIINWVNTANKWVPTVDESINYLNTNKQDKIDEGLLTDDKTVIGAINELFQSANNGKELIASAIGEPLDSSDTFSAMSDDINSLLSTFKTNMMNNGVTVESSDKFKSLIDKIATMVEEGSGKGIQFASGIAEKMTVGATFNKISSGSNGFSRISITGLKFEPVIIFAYNLNSISIFVNASIGSCFGYYDTTGTHITIALYGDATCAVLKHDGTNTIDFSNIILPTTTTTGEWNYYAIGVGEEDTTLRDSLASILTEEGVSVSDEDDMASLINKVDEEFSNDNNTISELETDAENTRSTLADLMLEGGYDIVGDEDINSLLDLLILSGISISDIKQIACGYNHTFILKNDGSIWSCGYNDYGQLGLNDTTKRTTFTQVTTNINNDVKQVVCGYQHTFILKNDGSVWACGRNNNGQLGLGNTTTYNTFTQVTTNIDNDVNQVACGKYHTFILKNDGSVYSCGYNSDGQLGLGTSTNTYKFTQVTTNINNDVEQIACGYHTFILKNDGSVWSCGLNGNGQLGLNDITNRTTFTQVTTNINNDVKQIACGTYHTFILKNDGSVYSCGYNNYGELGLGTSGNMYVTFTQVTTNINNDVKQIACSEYHTFILKNDGSVYSCGYNNYGELGLGNTTNQTKFIQVTTNINNDVKEVICGGSHTFILKNDGVWSCGNNNYGQLGLGNTTAYGIFVQIPK